MQSFSHIRLFDQVELILNVAGSKLQTAVDPDGTIHYQEKDSGKSGRCTFNIFWANQRQNRELFDAEVLEQLIIKRVQDYQDEVAIVPVTITRVALEEVRKLQEKEIDPNAHYPTRDYVDRAIAGVTAIQFPVGDGAVHPIYEPSNVPHQPSPAAAESTVAAPE